MWRDIALFIAGCVAGAFILTAYLILVFKGMFKDVFRW